MSGAAVHGGGKSVSKIAAATAKKAKAKISAANKAKAAADAALAAEAAAAAANATAATDVLELTRQRVFYSLCGFCCLSFICCHEESR